MFKTLAENYSIADKNASCTRLSNCNRFSFQIYIFYQLKYENKYIFSYYYHHHFIIIKFDLFSLIQKLLDESRI